MKRRPRVKKAPQPALATGPHPVIAPLVAIVHTPERELRACALAKLVLAELHDLNQHRDGIDLGHWYGLSCLESDALRLTRLLLKMFPRVQLPRPAVGGEQFEAELRLEEP